MKVTVFLNQAVGICVGYKCRRENEAQCETSGSIPLDRKIQMELEVESVRVLAGTNASYQRLLGLGAIWVGPEEFCILSILVSS